MGEGTGIASFSERDREEILNDPHSTIVDFPRDSESRMIVEVFNSTVTESGFSGMSGFNYMSLKDNLRWRGLSRKKYVPLLLNCMIEYLNGAHRRNN